MKDFDTLGFIAYLESTFDGYSGIDGLHLREIVENLCHYALCKYSSEPERFLAFLHEILPEEITISEIDQFIIE